MAKLKKASLTRWCHRRDIFESNRFLLCMFFIYAVINGIGIVRFDIEGMHTFLKWFNGTVMFGILGVILFLDLTKYNLLNYGQLFVKGEKGVAE